MPQPCPQCGAPTDGVCPHCGPVPDDAGDADTTEIAGLEGLTNEEILLELRRGARFVVFQYCVSFLVITLYRPSQVHFIRSTESAVLRGLPYTLLSLAAGWWGIPFGPFCTVAAILINLCGGRNVTPTSGMLDALNQS